METGDILHTLRTYYRDSDVSIPTGALDYGPRQKLMESREKLRELMRSLDNELQNSGEADEFRDWSEKYKKGLLWTFNRYYDRDKKEFILQEGSPMRDAIMEMFKFSGVRINLDISEINELVITVDRFRFNREKQFQIRISRETVKTKRVR